MKHPRATLRRRQPKTALNSSRHPLHRTALTYARNLMGAVEINEPSLAFVFSMLSEASTEALLSFVRSGFADEAEMKKAVTYVANLKRNSIDVMARWVLDNIETPTNGITLDALGDNLRDLLDRDMKAGDATEGGIHPRGMDDIRSLFRLNDADVELLKATLCYDQFKPFENLCDSVFGTDLFKLLSALTGVPESRIHSAGSREGRLVRCGLIRYPTIFQPGTFYRINSEMAEYLLGIRSEPLGAKFYRRGEGGTYTPGSFSLPPRSVEILKSLLSSDCPCNILLYGAPGTGKTEFAKALVKACNKASYFVQTGEDGENEHRRPSVVAATTTFAPQDAVVVVDEADALLNSRYAFTGTGGAGALRKEWLNDFLDECRAQVIWITNDISCMEESTRRRFTYAIEFKGYSARQREQVWQTHLKGHPLQGAINLGMVRELSREFQVNAAGIANALMAVKQVVPISGARPEIIRDTLRDILAGHEKLTGHDRHGKLTSLAAEYDPDAVNASVAPEVMVRALESFANIERWADRQPANLLFWGAPGTGKTAFAQYLAQSLGLELLIKRASDLLSMWVGGTEHNIRDAFEKAERENAILFLDEADSFFIDRQTAMHSWENSQTNELLTQMENHQGILICCTNLLEDLDHAAMRRFTWKVRFMPLTPEGKVRLYRKYFLGAGEALSGAAEARLERILDLTPGDIKAVWLRYKFEAGQAADGESIIAALEEEVAYKERGGKVTGFR